MVKLTRKTCFEKWIVHKGGKVFPGLVYIGPIHGRLAVSVYSSYESALMAIQMKDWLIKFLKIKP